MTAHVLVGRPRRGLGRHRRAIREAPEAGGIGVFTLGAAIVAISLILVVASATAVHVARMRLADLADELAIDAADAIDLGAYYSGAAGPASGKDLTLAQGRMNTAVAGHLARRAVGPLEGATVVSVSSPDGVSSVVTVELVVYPLFGIEALMPFADGITLTATGQARAF